MLESLVAGLLKKFLGSYVENFDPKQLNIGIWKGDVKLKDLKLKKEALDIFKLPINVYEGFLGELVLQIPWSNLKNKPVKVIIENVFLLAFPQDNQEYNQEEEDRRIQNLKKEKLERAELLDQKIPRNDTQKNQSFINSLITKIIDNLQIIVKNIHIRYEDVISDPEHPFSIGVTLSEFSAISTNDKWEPIFIQNSVDFIHKLVTLDFLTIYWNVDSYSFSKKSHDELLKCFKDLIVRNCHTPDHQLILKPVSGIGHITLNKNNVDGFSKIDIQLIFEELSFMFNNHQYRSALMMVDLFHFFIRQQKYHRFRPTGNISVKNNPKLWLQFAANSILHEIHEKNSKYTWDYLKKRRDQRIKYLDLFRKKLLEKIDILENEELQQLEYLLSYEDIRFYRSLAKNRLKKEKALSPKSDSQQSQGWLSWLWSGSQNTDENKTDLIMTDEQRQELYDAIEWDEKKNILERLDNSIESVNLKLSLSLKAGSFILTEKTNIKQKDIISFFFNDFNSNIIQRSNSFAFEFDLGGLSVYDGTTEDSVYPQIVKANINKNKIYEFSDTKFTQNDLNLEKKPPISDNSPFFYFKFEKNPLNNDADTSVTARLKSMEVIYNPHCLTAVSEFFQPPKSQMVSIEVLMEAASATVEDIRNQTRAGLEFALEEHKTVLAKLDLQAPLIIIPQSYVKTNCNCIILDAGHISLESNLVEKEKILEIQSKHNKVYSKEDYSNLKSLMYDKFSLKFESIQLLIGLFINDTSQELREKNSKSFKIIDKTDMFFLLEISILSKASNLTKFKISGHLPLLHASISDEKYKILMEIINNAIPSFKKDSSEIKKSKSQKKSSNLSKSNTHKSISFSFSHQEDLIIKDESDFSDDKETELYEDAMSNQEYPAFQQKIFELDFMVNKLQLSLYKANTQETFPDQLLVDIVLEHFSLLFSTTLCDITAEIILKRFFIEDKLEANTPIEFKHLVSSDDIIEENNKTTDLIHIKYTKTKIQSSGFSPVYHDIEQSIDVSLSTITFVITRKTILTLFDFIINTFTTSSNQNSHKNSSEKNILSKNKQDDTILSNNIYMKISLTKIIFVLNDDGICLSTLALSKADVNIFLTQKTMRFSIKLGNLSLLNNSNVDSMLDSSIKELISIEGEELADFRYELYDSSNETTYPGYDTLIYLSLGSVKVNFLKEPFQKIIEFGTKFAQMKSFYNSARNVAINQASQIQESVNKIHFNILIRTPILIFHEIKKIKNEKNNIIIANLGEIYASNSFETLKEELSIFSLNKISARIKDISLYSHFQYEYNKVEELEMLDSIDISFIIEYIEHIIDSKRPNIRIIGSMTDLNFKLTDRQYCSLIRLSQDISEVFSSYGNKSPGDLEKNLEIDSKNQETTKSEITEINFFKEHVEDFQCKGRWTKLDMKFSVGVMGLEIFSNNLLPIDNIFNHSLAKFSLNTTMIKIRMFSDSSLESELQIKSFVLENTKFNKSNKFREAISAIKHDGYQFMASLSISGQIDKNIIAILTVDSPKFIFALDHIFELKKFAMINLESESSKQDINDSYIDKNLKNTRPIRRKGAQNSEKTLAKTKKTFTISYRVNIVDADIILLENMELYSSEAVILSIKQILLSQQDTECFFVKILLENMELYSSEAVILSIKQILLSQQDTVTLSINQIGMFLCKMNNLKDNKIRILDDFTAAFTMDSKKLNKMQSLTNIIIEVDPLIFRLSLRDIILILNIVTKVFESPESNKNIRTDIKSAKMKGHTSIKKVDLNKNTYSIKSENLDEIFLNPKTNINNKEHIITTKEELRANIQGLRFILIGCHHDLPTIDISINKFVIYSNDWSSKLSINTNLNLFINSYNFSNSHWEPLVEPWQFEIHATKSIYPEMFSITLFSQKRLEIIITSNIITTITEMLQFLNQTQNNVSKYQPFEAPYKIQNKTGYSINIWSNSSKDTNSKKKIYQLKNGDSIAWKFENWRQMRNNISDKNQKYFIGVHLENTGWNPIEDISINYEGETLYSLEPKKDILHRLLIKTILGRDNIKYITLKSTFSLENQTQIPIEIMILNNQDKHSEIYKIEPGDDFSVPIEHAYYHALKIRPDSHLGYSWSSHIIEWQKLLEHSSLIISCESLEKKDNLFNFQIHARYDKSNPLVKVYPYMTIKISPLIVIQNHLPYDLTYKIFDKNTKSTLQNFLKKQDSSPIHTIDLSHVLLMGIHIENTVYKSSSFSIINTPNPDKIRRETKIVVTDKDNLKLCLYLHYYEIPDSGKVFRITIYCPYLILNKTGLDIQIKSKLFLQQAKIAAGQFSIEPTKKAVPYMFSYGNHDRKNRALIKIGNSNWSKPQSFEAIGSISEIVLGSPEQKEIHLGIVVKEGEGEYKLTKIVNLTPRFILKSGLEENINIKQPKSSNIMTLYPLQKMPLYFMEQASEKQLVLCFPGTHNEWSSPFNIQNLGRIHIKLSKYKEDQQLIRIEIMLEEATVFIHLLLEKNNWPYSIRNESDVAFTFYQPNYHVSVNDYGKKNKSPHYNIKAYLIPAKSVMPYAWDYPASKNKELVFSANGKERTIRLSEIGNLVPMKIPTDNGLYKTIDISVIANGPSQTLVLKNYCQEESIYKPKANISQSSSTLTNNTYYKEGFEVINFNDNITYKTEIKLEGIGISIINDRPLELCYITLRDLNLKFSDSPIYQNLDIIVKWIQIDNQLYGGIYPIILYPSVIQKASKDLDTHPSFHSSIIKVKDDSYGVIYIKYATLLIQEMTLEIDEDFLFALLEFTKHIGQVDSEQAKEVLFDENLGIPEPQKNTSGTEIYFEVLHIQPAQLNLSFVRTERVNVEDKTSSKNPFLFFLNILTMAIGNINDAPVRLNSLLMENVLISLPLLLQHIQSHYSQDFFHQIHKILGSADFLGNPVGLFNTVSSGVIDIFYEPYHGFVMNESPHELGFGLVKGTASFVRKTVFGITDSVSKFTGSISKGLSMATMDKKFQNRRRITQGRNRPKHALYGVTAGANSFVTSIASGVEGLARKPLEGVEKDGAAGFFKGVGKGIIGLATKPVVGIFDLASNVTEGIRNTTTVFESEGIDKVRLTRFIGRDALGLFLLKQINNGKYFDEEYLAHLNILDDSILMITYTRIMVIKSRKLSIEWETLLSDIQTISLKKSGIVLVLRDKTNCPFIPIDSSSSQKFIFTKIVRRTLALESKLREAAQSLSRLHSNRGKRISRQVEDQLLISNSKIEEAAEELWRLQKNEHEVSVKLLKHTAGVLRYALEKHTMSGHVSNFLQEKKPIDLYDFNELHFYKPNNTEFSESTEPRKNKINDNISYTLIEIQKRLTISNNQLKSFLVGGKHVTKYSENEFHSNYSSIDVLEILSELEDTICNVHQQYLELKEASLLQIAEFQKNYKYLWDKTDIEECPIKSYSIEHGQFSIDTLISRVDLLTSELSKSKKMYKGLLEKEKIQEENNLSAINSLKLEYENKINDLDMDLSKAKKTIGELVVRESSISSELYDANEKISEYQQTIDALNEEIEIAKHKKEDDYKKWEDDQKDLKNTIKDYANQIKDNETKLQELNDIYSNLLKSHSDSLLDFQKKIKQKESTLELLQDEISKLQNINSMLEEKIQFLQCQHKNQQLEYENKANEIIRDLENDVVKLSTEITILKAEMDVIYNSKQQQIETGMTMQQIQDNDKNAIELEKKKEIEMENKFISENIKMSDSKEVQEQKLIEVIEKNKAILEKDITLEKRCQLLQSELNEMLNDFEQITRNMLDFESERTHLKNTIDALKEKCEELESQLSDKKIQWLNKENLSPEKLNIKKQEAVNIELLRKEFHKMMQELREEHSKKMKYYMYTFQLSKSNFLL
ncbi:hypothetical protein PORY_000852 [Pneumocystis oryctolagi]|uniref:Uncharacterized protein n=1 Tax=Pneumocystis oryctolagi TaxID=42067 RepID=A0ACB7CDU5_9ASCO|nr:hypothetical protein PORY_000852 [Pneumocystis oryctolagi]